MIYYDQLPLSEDILKALAELNIDYVFQPIFYPDGKKIYAREALMRPKDKTVTELMDEYAKMDKLHIIEVATFFGAMQAFILRGYTEWISVNSFPSECMSDDEAKAFADYFGDIRGKLIIEMLEYPELSVSKWTTKNESVRLMDNLISMDDYGTGINNFGKVDILKPDIVKLDRSLISDIDKDEYKQSNCKEIIDLLHMMNKIVVAEGVETKEEFEYLVSIEADLFQGYYLARPQ